MINRIANRGALLFFASIALTAFLGSAAAASLAAPYRADSTSRLNDATFHVLVPAALPSGARLLLTDVQRNPDGSSDVNVFYALPGDGRLHLYESDRSAAALGTKDPLSVPGTVVSGAATDWLQHEGFSGHTVELDARLASVLVSVDAPIPAAELLAVVNSLR